MKLSVRSRLQYTFENPTDAIVSVQAAWSPDQFVLSEWLTIDPVFNILQDPIDPRGERRFRVRLEGEVTITYEAVVDNYDRPRLTPDLRIRDMIELPAETLQYLTPSRYCPSDLFARFAQREFGALQGGVQILAVLDWLYTHLDYQHGVSNATTTAHETFTDRAGVCRDFTHLGITLCRALGVPARAVSAYALNLEPPDFHAVFEVYLENGWYMVDATRLADPSGLVRIGVGRDAADIAFLSTNGPCELVEQSVSVMPASDL